MLKNNDEVKIKWNGSQAELVYFFIAMQGAGLISFENRLEFVKAIESSFLYSKKGEFVVPSSVTSVISRTKNPAYNEPRNANIRTKANANEVVQVLEKMIEWVENTKNVRFPLKKNLSEFFYPYHSANCGNG